jgi:hypothetical protein
MVGSNYDVNAMLALATTAEHEGDLSSALGFVAEAHRVARVHHEALAQVHSFRAHLHARTVKRAALGLFAAVL